MTRDLRSYRTGAAENRVVIDDDGLLQGVPVRIMLARDDGSLTVLVTLMDGTYLLDVPCSAVVLDDGRARPVLAH
jgi:hypothetical protein